MKIITACLMLIGITTMLFADMFPLTNTTVLSKNAIYIERVYYIGDFKESLENVIVPEGVSSAKASFGRLRLLGSCMSFAFKLDGANYYGTGLLFEKSGVSEVRFFSGGTVFGIRTVGSKLEKSTVEKTVLFYSKEGFPEQEITRFFDLKDVRGRSKPAR